jgi:hypothetical protein
VFGIGELKGPQQEPIGLEFRSHDPEYILQAFVGVQIGCLV